MQLSTCNIEALFRKIFVDKHIEIRVNFCNNGDDICKMLYDNRQYIQNIWYINLSYCKITDVGAGHLSSILRENNSIISLDISFNSIQSTGILWIFNALTFNNRLQKLYMSNNSCNSVALAPDILDHIKFNYSLTLVVSDGFGDYKYALAEYLAQNQQSKWPAIRLMFVARYKSAYSYFHPNFMNLDVFRTIAYYASRPVRYANHNTTRVDTVADTPPPSRASLIRQISSHLHHG